MASVFIILFAYVFTGQMNSDFVNFRKS